MRLIHVVVCAMSVLACRDGERAGSSPGRHAAPLGAPVQLTTGGPTPLDQPSSLPGELGLWGQAGGAVVFAATDAAHGRELFRSNGTRAGTRLLRDLHPGPTSGLVKPTGTTGPLIASRGGLAVFAADDGKHGFELWRTDGTPQGTYLLGETTPGLPSRQVTEVAAVGTGTFFFATSALITRGLYRTDGTVEGTAAVRLDVRARSLIDVGGTLFFLGEMTGSSAELFKSDGTAEGTVGVADLCPGSCTTSPLFLTAFGDALYFVPSASVSELWRSDGTASGTGKFVSLPGLPGPLLAVGGVLYFAVANSSTGMELWRSDGTTQGTTAVKVIAPGSANKFVGDFVAASDVLFFAADDGTHGLELWRSDGTAEGTHLVRDVNPGAAAALEMGIPAAARGAGVVFRADDGSTGKELWTSDGTANGTTLLRDIMSGIGSSRPNSLYSAGGLVYFNASDGVVGFEPWRTDGTTAETVNLADLHVATVTRNPTDLVVLGDTLLFTANDVTSGAELWRSDGTTTGTQLVHDLYAGGVGSGPTEKVVAGGIAYFRARTSSHGYELFRSDGTQGGTALAADIFAGSSSSTPTHLAAVGDRVYFAATTAAGSEPWVYSVAEGLRTLGDLAASSAGSTPAEFTGSGTRVYFTAEVTSTDRRLWVTDGTAEGTSSLKGTGLKAGFTWLTDVAGTLYFVAAEGAGFEVHRTDGSTVTLVKDIGVGGGNADPLWLTALGGTLYFSAVTPELGRELWRSDGTAEGTVPVLDLYAGLGSSGPSNLAVWGGLLVFQGDDGAGLGWFASDGTAAGTRRLTSALPGMNPSVFQGGITPQRLRLRTTAASTLFFPAADAAGNELWASEGEALSTRRVTDLLAGPPSPSPTDFALAAPYLFFTAHDGLGTQLWAIDVLAPDPPDAAVPAVDAAIDAAVIAPVDATATVDAPPLTPDAAVAPDAATSPDAAEAPDAAVSPDAAAAPDAAVALDAATSPDAATAPDAAAVDDAATTPPPDASAAIDGSVAPDASAAIDGSVAPDASTAVDGSVAPDASTTTDATASADARAPGDDASGCGCAVRAADTAPSFPWPLLALLALRRRRVLPGSPR